MYTSRKYVVILGDCNLCSKLWEDDSYQFKELSNMVKDFLLEEASHKMVTEVTRVELVAGVLQTSTIDHCYSDAPEKIT